MPRHFLNGLAGAAATVAFLLFLRVIWSPDPAQSLFARAQRLESAGQIPLALRHYALISDTHPESFYAARALLRQGDLLAERGRQNGDKGALQSAVSAYARLAKAYPSDPLATEALLDAGRVAAENLGDRAAAKGFYNLLLQKSGSRSDAAATATLKLGRLALDERDGKTAQTLLQLVLRQWPNLTDRAAEAQFHLGVAYETLFKNPEWATRAYDATIARYPSSTWANDARVRLGLSVFSDTKGRRPARRVFIETRRPLPDDGGATGSLWASLRPILAAHGIEADDATLRGWSLMPFYAGFDPKNPSRIVKAPFDAFENVLANAGLMLTVKHGGKEAEALKDLSDEIDAEHAPLVYFEEKGKGTWALAVGYDSDRGEVMLLSRGARFDTLAAKSFAAMWKAPSSFGSPYTMISVLPAGAKARPNPSLTPTPLPTPLPGQTPAPALLTPPSFVWQLPQLSAKNADRRALQRASALLLRPRQGEFFLNAEGLSLLAGELKKIARVRVEVRVVPTPLPTPTPFPTPTPLPADPSEPESPYAPAVTPTPLPTAVPSVSFVPLQNRNDGARARSLLSFLEAAAREWAVRRREGALWLDGAANRLNDPEIKGAAAALRASAEALDEAILLAPSDLGDALGAGERAQIGEVARQIERARDAEREAANLMK
ncbi:MAG: hypothetical protein KY445_12725 [Armatimonadetes bacterium]|nr:hypothetical protein [Armatimonadota bacterium]